MSTHLVGSPDERIQRRRRAAVDGTVHPGGSGQFIELGGVDGGSLVHVGAEARGHDAILACGIAGRPPQKRQIVGLGLPQADAVQRCHKHGVLLPENLPQLNLVRQGRRPGPGLEAELLFLRALGHRLQTQKRTRVSAGGGKSYVQSSRVYEPAVGKSRRKQSAGCRRMGERRP